MNNKTMNVIPNIVKNVTKYVLETFGKYACEQKAPWTYNGRSNKVDIAIPNMSPIKSIYSTKYIPARTEKTKQHCVMIRLIG